MADLPTMSEQMFLDRSSMDSFVRHVRKTNAVSLGFASRLNAFGNRALFSLHVSSDDARELLLATLLRRALTSFQASVILCERGLPLETQVILRAILEITFKIVAIAKDEEVSQLYIGEGVINRRKKYQKLQKLSSTALDVDMDAMRAAHNELKEEIQSKGISELTTLQFATRAGLADFYHSAYSVLSDAVHSSVNTLDSALDLDDSGELVGLKYGFSDENLDHHVFTACEALILSLHAALPVICADMVEEAGELKMEFRNAYSLAIGVE